MKEINYNILNIILSIIIIVLIICIVNSTEYFLGYSRGRVNILPCDCNAEPSCHPDCPNYVSPYAPLSDMFN
jgi:hypothetical protein